VFGVPAASRAQVRADAPPPPIGESQNPTVDQTPAHLAIVDGAATLERDGQSQAAAENMAVLAGDRLRTRSGRVEVLFADGSTLDLDDSTSVDLLSDSLLRLVAGSVRLLLVRGLDSNVASIVTPLEYRVDAAAASVTIRTAGEYRISTSDSRSDAEVELAVWRGAAELQNGLGRTLVRAGMLARTTGAQAITTERFNVASADAFDRWVLDRRDARVDTQSAQYLPADLRYYGSTMDQYGSWDYLPEYGQVWYPTVDAAWHPYYNGSWSFGASLGWFWVGYDRWAWPTHHYGRWGLRGNRWFWVPGYRYAPAWVSWAYSPGYVSWCPLGYNGYPVVGVASVSYWRGWSVVPAHRFAPNFVVPRAVVAPGNLSPGWRNTLVVRNSAPQWRGVQSTAVPLRAPGGRVTAAQPRADVRAAGPGYGRDTQGYRSYASPRPLPTDSVRTGPSYGSIRSSRSIPPTINQPQSRPYATIESRGQSPTNNVRMGQVPYGSYGAAPRSYGQSDRPAYTARPQDGQQPSGSFGASPYGGSTWRTDSYRVPPGSGAGLSPGRFDNARPAPMPRGESRMTSNAPASGSGGAVSHGGNGTAAGHGGNSGSAGHGGGGHGGR
jgi:hypothetical protein